MRSKALKQEALQAAREAKKERGKYLLALICVICICTVGEIHVILTSIIMWKLNLVSFGSFSPDAGRAEATG